MKLIILLIGIGGNGLVWEGFNDEHNITLTSYTNSSGVTPDEMLRIDIYVGDVFLKTIFPESTVANFKLKGSEVLRLINGSYRVFPDGSDNKGQSGIQMRVFGHNGQKTISSRTSVFTPNDSYLPDITPDMTVYRKTSTWGGIGDVAFITFNSLKEPIYFNQYYIDPSMTPITLKADDGNVESSAGLHFSGNYILGDGWYMDPEGTTVGYETVGIGDYNAEDSIFYQGEPIYESAYQHNTGHEKIISNLRLNGASVSYRFDSDTGNISISGIPLGENNISYDIAVPSLGNSTSVDKDIYIIERDGLDRVRQNSFNNDKYHHEANVKISYETSWGTSGEEEKGLSYYSSAGFSNITMKQIIFSRMLSSDAMVKFVRARPSIYNATSSGFIPIQDDMRYRVDFHQTLYNGMDYNGSFDYTVKFEDGTEFTESVNVSDLFTVDRIKDIQGVGTAFSIDSDFKYIKPRSSAFGQLQSNYFSWEEKISRMDTSIGWISSYYIEGYGEGGNSVSTVYGGSVQRVGKNSFIGILQQPVQSERYGHPSTKSAVTELEYRSFNNNFVTDLGGIFNIPFGEPHSYLGKMCPSATGDLDIPVDPPLDPPNDPGRPEIVLSSTIDGDCYSASASSVYANLNWNYVDGITGWAVYLDQNDDGIFSESEKIEDLSENKKTFRHNVVSNPDYVPGKQYNYQLKSYFTNGTSRTNTTIVTVPSEICLECGSANGQYNVSQKPNSNLCSTGTQSEVLGSSTEWGDNSWTWSCQKYEQIEYCEAYCPWGSVFDGDSCYNPDCGPISGSVVSSMPNGYNDTDLCANPQDYLPVQVEPVDDDWDGTYDRWNWDCDDEWAFACSAYCPVGQTISSDGMSCEGDIITQLSCGILEGPISVKPLETNTDLCSADANVVSGSIYKDSSYRWGWECTQDSVNKDCFASCPNGYKIYEDQCILDNSSPVVSIDNFIVNPGIIKEGGNCKLDWFITTSNSSLIDCVITSDSKSIDVENTPQSIGLDPNIQGSIKGDNTFMNVDATTNYTLSCRSYDPDTETIGNVIDTKQARCTVNPKFFGF